MNQRVGTIDDSSLNTLDTNYSRHFLTVQVSTKLSNEESEQNDDLIMGNLINASKKFIIHQMKESLVIGVRHYTLNVTIDDICAFETWIENFQIVEKAQRYAQMYFQVYTIVQWKTLIESGKDIFKENSLSILLKRIKANGWNRKIGMLLGP